MQEITLTRLAIPLSVLYQDLSALHNDDGHAFQIPAFKKVIVCAMFRDIDAILNDLIGIVMPNVTMGSDKVLSPLLEQQRALRAKDGGVEEEIFSKSPKEMLSAFEELFTFVEAIRKVKGDTEEKKAEDIKTILAESIKEKSE